ncbi:MAG: hypothetical protein K0B08_01575 [Bacteroidales bacterium]|nr:hypothetical protein [Bacteroidales bacterium]
MITLSSFTTILQGQYQSYEPVIIEAVRLTGNKITRDKIIYRELMFSPGDTLPVEHLDSLVTRAKENLMNTSLFNFVETELMMGKDSLHVIVSFHFTERWYIWPIPILKISDRNFNVWWETKDWSRLSYGFYVNWRNFSGNKDNLTTTLQFGFDRLFSVQYNFPYLNARQMLGMGFGAGRWRQKETAYVTDDNRQQFFQDQDNYAREDLYGFGRFFIRPGIYNTHLLEIRYDHHHFSDSLLAQNEYYSVKGYDNVQYFSFRYHFKSDHRDYKQYPLKGYYFDIEAVKHGLGVFKKPAMNTFHLMAAFRKFWELQPRLYFATGLNGRASAGDYQPYFLLQGIGYGRDIVRAYEYFVVDARHFVIFKNNLKYALVPQREDRIRFIRSEKFGRIFYALYLNVFLDAGYGYFEKELARESNDLQNSLLLGYGTGVDFTTYYDIVIRLEFSMNLMNKPGIYLHFMAPI